MAFLLRYQLAPIVQALALRADKEGSNNLKVSLSMVNSLQRAANCYAPQAPFKGSKLRNGLTPVKVLSSPVTT